MSTTRHAHNGMYKKYTQASAIILFLITSAEAWACEQCRPLIKSSVYNADFLVNFSLLMLPLGILAVLGVITHYWDEIMARLQPRKGDKHGE